jgi:hypothetical protein
MMQVQPEFISVKNKDRFRRCGGRDNGTGRKKKQNGNDCACHECMLSHNKAQENTKNG